MENCVINSVATEAHLPADGLKNGRFSIRNGRVDKYIGQSATIHRGLALAVIWMAYEHFVGDLLPFFNFNTECRFHISSIVAKVIASSALTLVPSTATAEKTK